MNSWKRISGSSLRKSILANLCGVGVQLLNQILLVPLFLRLWDVKLYGDWIVISAISSFFFMSDAGLNSVTSNRFTISFSSGRKEECRSLLANNYLLIVVVGSLSLLGSLGYVLSWNIVSSLGLHQLDRWEASYVFVMLILQVFLGMGSSVIDVIYRASSLNHKMVNLGNVGRLVEFFVILLSLVLHLRLWQMVTIYLLPRCLIFFYKAVDTRKYFAYSFHFGDVDIPLLKSMIFPSLTFMAFPAGNAIVYQGFTLLVNKAFGAESVVLFNTTRTLCSFLRQLLSTMQQAVWPEYSIAYGKHDVARMRDLHRKAFSIAMAGGLIIGIFLLLAGPWIYRFWTHSKILFSYPLMEAFLVVTLCEVTWQTSSVCLKATNTHSRLGIAYVVTAILSIVVALLLHQFSRSLPLIELCLLVIHVPLSAYAIRQGLVMTSDNVEGLISAFSFKQLIGRLKRINNWKCI